MSTDCLSGPAEILEVGRYGALVPVEDVEATARAIHAVLDGAHDAERLKVRAAEFALERAAERYLAVLCGDKQAGCLQTKKTFALELSWLVSIGVTLTN